MLTLALYYVDGLGTLVDAIFTIFVMVKACDLWCMVFPLLYVAVSELFYRWYTKTAEGSDL
jgi:hypothetical protein